MYPIHASYKWLWLLMELGRSNDNMQQIHSCSGPSHGFVLQQWKCHFIKIYSETKKGSTEQRVQNRVLFIYPQICVLSKDKLHSREAYKWIVYVAPTT